MAHDSIEQLQILLKLLDYSDNDIYLHIDRKSTIQESECRSCIGEASLHIYKIYSVYHADLSQTKCQLFLLREATKDQHDYYHFISGHDLPIKKHHQIVNFFEKNQGKEFIHIENEGYSDKDACIYFHFFYGWIKKHPRSIFLRYASRIESCLISLQKKMHVKRKFYCGANWFSITHNLAVEYCKYHKKLLRRVRWTISSDECVLQTFFLENAKDRYKLYVKHTSSSNDYSGTARLIDWCRGNPYVWRMSDYKEIIISDRMFARKFDWCTDSEIIKKIEEDLQE